MECLSHALQQIGNCWVSNMPSHTSRCREKLASLVNHSVVLKLSANTLAQQRCYGPKQNSVSVRLSLRHTHRPCLYCTNQFATQCQCWWGRVSAVLSMSQWRKGSGDDVPRIWDKVVSKACADSAGNTHWRLSTLRIVAQQRNLSNLHDHLQEKHPSLERYVLRRPSLTRGLSIMSQAAVRVHDQPSHALCLSTEESLFGSERMLQKKIITLPI